MPGRRAGVLAADAAMTPTFEPPGPRFIDSADVQDVNIAIPSKGPRGRACPQSGNPRRSTVHNRFRKPGDAGAHTGGLSSVRRSWLCGGPDAKEAIVAGHAGVRPHGDARDDGVGTRNQANLNGLQSHRGAGARRHRLQRRPGPRCKGLVEHQCLRGVRQGLVPECRCHECVSARREPRRGGLRRRIPVLHRVSSPFEIPDANVKSRCGGRARLWKSFALQSLEQPRHTTHLRGPVGSGRQCID